VFRAVLLLAATLGRILLALWAAVLLGAAVGTVARRVDHAPA
jgi:hypothetical protein